MIDKTFVEILEITAEDFPNSIVADLLRDFPADFVVRFIEIYSGQRFYVPNIEAVYRKYRNKVIKQTLDKKDTKEIRLQLARHFSITLEQLRQTYIYTSERKKPKVFNAKSMEDSAKRLFRKEAKRTIREMKKVLFKK